jgi:hypothetical protein
MHRILPSELLFFICDLRVENEIMRVNTRFNMSIEITRREGEKELKDRQVSVST